jgi:hypothetical protein
MDRFSRRLAASLIGDRRESAVDRRLSPQLRAPERATTFDRIRRVRFAIRAWVGTV